MTYLYKYLCFSLSDGLESTLSERLKYAHMKVQIYNHNASYMSYAHENNDSLSTF